MFKVIVNTFVEETLEKVFLRYKKTFYRLSKALDELEEKGLRVRMLSLWKMLPKYSEKE